MKREAEAAAEPAPEPAAAVGSATGSGSSAGAAAVATMAGAGATSFSTSSPACLALAASSAEAFCTANGFRPRLFSSCASQPQSGEGASAGRRPHSNTAGSPPKKSGVAANSVEMWVSSAACSALLRMTWISASRVVFSSSAGAGRNTQQHNKTNKKQKKHKTDSSK